MPDSDQKDVFNTTMSALSAGVRTLQDSFTYKAATAALTPIVVVLLLAYLTLQDRISSVSGLGDVTDVLGLGVVWALIFIVVTVAAEMWFYIAVGLRTVTKARGQELPTKSLLSAAASRLFPVLGALVLLLLLAAVLWIVGLLLKELAGLDFISIIVSLLTIPLLIAWIVVTLSVIVGGSFIAGVAASKPEAGPSRILRRSIGIALAYPAPAILTSVFAGVAALITFILLLLGLAVGLWVGLVPILSEMNFESQDIAENFATIQTIGFALVLFMVPFGIVAGAAAMFDHLLGDDPVVEAAPTRLLGMGWLRMRRAAKSAGSAAGRIKNKMDESASQVTPASVTQPDDTVKYCSSCGTDNPPDFKFCRSCGTPAPA